MAFGLISADDKNKIASFGEEIVSVAQNDKNVTFTKSNGNTSTLRLPDDFCPKIEVIANGGVSAVATCGNLTTGLVTFGTHDDGTDTGIADTSCTLLLPDYGTWTVTLNHQCTTHTKVIEVTECKPYTCDFGIKFYAVGFAEDCADVVDTASGSADSAKFQVQHFMPKNILGYVNDAYNKKPMSLTYADWGSVYTENSSVEARQLYYNHSDSVITEDILDYSDWENDWFIKDCKPCMLRYDGTVAYYLDPNDYNKKLDGTDSDVNNPDFEGNAMVEIPLTWTCCKNIDLGNNKYYRIVIVSNIKFDNDFNAYAHTRSDGTISPVFYYAMFCSYDIANDPFQRGDRRINTGATYRSLSYGPDFVDYYDRDKDGNKLTTGNCYYTPEEMRAKVAANGENWDYVWYLQYMLIIQLLMIMRSPLISLYYPTSNDSRKNIAPYASLYRVRRATRAQSSETDTGTNAVVMFPPGSFGKMQTGIFSPPRIVYYRTNSYSTYGYINQSKVFHIDQFLSPNRNILVKGIRAHRKGYYNYTYKHWDYTNNNQYWSLKRSLADSDFTTITEERVTNSVYPMLIAHFDENWLPIYYKTFYRTSNYTSGVKGYPIIFEVNQSEGKNTGEADEMLAIGRRDRLITLNQYLDAVGAGSGICSIYLMYMPPAT